MAEDTTARAERLRAYLASHTMVRFSARRFARPTNTTKIPVSVLSNPQKNKTWRGEQTIFAVSRAGSGVECPRRYKDFVAVHKALRLRFPHAVIPELPPSEGILPRRDASDKRASALDRWLGCVCRHPFVGRDEIFGVFCDSQDKFSTAIKDVPITKNAARDWWLEACDLAVPPVNALECVREALGSCASAKKSANDAKLNIKDVRSKLTSLATAHASAAASSSDWAAHEDVELHDGLELIAAKHRAQSRILTNACARAATDTAADIRFELLATEGLRLRLVEVKSALEASFSAESRASKEAEDSPRRDDLLASATSAAHEAARAARAVLSMELPLFNAERAERILHCQAVFAASCAELGAASVSNWKGESEAAAATPAPSPYTRAPPSVDALLAPAVKRTNAPLPTTTVTAAYEFIAEHDDELTMRIGDVGEMQPFSADWGLVTSVDGRKGIVPLEFLSIAMPPTIDVARRNSQSIVELSDRNAELTSHMEYLDDQLKEERLVSGTLRAEVLRLEGEKAESEAEREVLREALRDAQSNAKRIAREAAEKEAAAAQTEPAVVATQPAAPAQQQEKEAPSDWVRGFDERYNRHFWHNPITKESVWTKPPGAE